MYIRARREAIKIAEKAAPAVIIWFRPLAMIRLESGDISPARPVPDLADDDGARSRRQPVGCACRIGGAVVGLWLGHADRDRQDAGPLDVEANEPRRYPRPTKRVSAMKKAAGSMSSGRRGSKLIGKTPQSSAPVFSGYPSLRGFGVQKAVPPKGTGKLLRRRHRIDP